LRRREPVASQVNSSAEKNNRRCHYHTCLQQVPDQFFNSAYARSNPSEGRRI
jgi:hypothetical protein